MSPMITDPMNPAESGTYGCTTTKRGRALIAKILAQKMPLTITRTMVGSGICPEGMFPGELQDLVEPVAAATSNEPMYDGDTVHMTVEYRSDLNGGLDHGFWLREFGVFARDLDGEEVLLYYGTLGDYPQWVSAYSKTGIDTRRFPTSITVGEGATVIIDYSPEAFMTSEDVMDLCTSTVLPMFLEQAQGLIYTHNTDPAAHEDIRQLALSAAQLEQVYTKEETEERVRAAIARHDTDREAHAALHAALSSLENRLNTLELKYGANVTGNPFTVSFGDLTGLVVTGVWNQAYARVEF